VSHLTRGPGRWPGIGSKANPGLAPTPGWWNPAWRVGGGTVSHLTRGPGRRPGIVSKANPGLAPTPGRRNPAWRIGAEAAR